MLNCIMPRFENNLSKSIYILVNIFFLIAAPFNLGYYSTKLIQGDIPNMKEEGVMIAGVNVVRRDPHTDNSTIITQEVEEEVIETIEVTPTIIQGSNMDIIEQPTDRSDYDYLGPIMATICIDDPIGGADWTIYLNDNPRYVEIRRDELERFNSKGLFFYCRQKVVIDDPRMDILVTRMNDVETIEASINFLGSNRTSYIILRYNEVDNTIIYEITEEEPR